MKTVLVTGGAGYIGCNVVRSLASKGYTPVVYDNLSGGFRDFVSDFELIIGDIGNYDLVCETLKSYSIDCVMNFASFIAVGESCNYPLKYYDNNASKTITLLKAMTDCGVNKFIFSSTAAVYGTPLEVPITENSPLKPESPYGRTKLMVENILSDLSRSQDFRYMALRYFNAAGAVPDGTIGESHIPETHLIPLVLRAALDPDYVITIFGEDYPTKDGTCIRDYIHVTDLADAHVLALEKLFDGSESSIYNLGNGTGFSVKEVIDSAKKITGKDFSIKSGPRRDGDPAILVASSDKAHSELGWVPQYPDIDNIVSSAWNWEKQKKRKGY
ncbi:MAG: UDP-glucose 4-epimerase GalE [Spirochaetes bacterium]|nr:UDP-glucose 4-epimerase GalE [Spirochaetota bacterium]MBN2769874.1 UDP-glucose 4-epimerase GalE [Spirochaetota bacterium]